ncbi:MULTISPECIES: ribosome small subunit-dependent GTPase A [Paenibacillus]|uniref:Small ribosomal subunit biogenesis GTPase RsgA n=1 Tax=Paenibacillus anseongense TaxID=2682845 RepID=A0ABW9UC62_9BACL|nr:MULTISPECIES: ribosome small subunit-dependent GTPase A [Paenibacillus]MBA2937924.1 ribosome small subunit-dependent GTPase A [Paenibacillus sp. CGMCC 1.16610]MVQ36982.1 ribosome small subunit-dependent GTPase A [Paenibacillus anseongense]
MPQGMIVKALSGYYYVLPEGAELQDANMVTCRGRGVFKNRKITPLVGDRVVFEETENGEGTVTEILPRSSELIRPPIANVNVVVLVFSVTEPVLNLQLLDKFLVHIEHTGIEVVLCFTKSDLLSADPDTAAPKEMTVAELERITKLYEGIGYPVLKTSSRLKVGVESILQHLEGAVSVFAGQSGVGKSSLLNAMISGRNLETNEISQRLGRGKHTTRHVELLPLNNGGLVADTPGFSQLDFMEVEAEGLSSCFKEFAEVAEGCRFRGCLHLHEPDCKVRDAVAEGTIAASRYDHYLLFLGEIKDRKRRY